MERPFRCKFGSWINTVEQKWGMRARLRPGRNIAAAQAMIRSMAAGVNRLEGGRRGPGHAVWRGDGDDILYGLPPSTLSLPDAIRSMGDRARAIQQEKRIISMATTATTCCMVKSATISCRATPGRTGCMVGQARTSSCSRRQAPLPMRGRIFFTISPPRRATSWTCMMCWMQPSIRQAMTLQTLLASPMTQPGSTRLWRLIKMALALRTASKTSQPSWLMPISMSMPC